MVGTLVVHSPWTAIPIILVPTGVLCIIQPGWLELPLAKTIFHGPSLFEPLKFYCITFDNVFELITKFRFSSNSFEFIN